MIGRRELCGSLMALPASLLAAGCRTVAPLVDFSETSRGFLAKDYPRVYQRWTRHSRVMYDEGTLIELWATLKSWEFREAYVERYAEVYSLNAADKANLRGSQLEAARRGFEIHLAAQMTDYRWNDLEKRSSPWRVSLADATGDELTARTITAPRLPRLYETEFFPQFTPFSRTYLVEFTADPEQQDSDFGGPQSGLVALRVAGPLGRAELIWQAR